ncbi:MAG: DNA repair protein RecO [bacterium]|nr:DNA repair protein RecO [bacterium]
MPGGCNSRGNLMSGPSFKRLTGIPIASYRARGSARVVAFFTEEEGQVRAAVRAGSKRSGGLVPSLPSFSTFDLLLSKTGARRDLFDLREREVRALRPNLGKGEPLAAWAAASVEAELILKTTEIQHPEPYLYRMFEKSLDCLEAGAPPRALLIAFLAKYLERSGHGPRLDRAVDGGPLPAGSPWLFDIRAGGILPSGQGNSPGIEVAEGRRAFPITRETLDTLKKFRLAVFERLEETPLPVKTGRLLVELFAACIEIHLETRLKSLDFWRETVEGKGAEA